MKNLILSLFICSSFALFSQEATTEKLPKTSKHELSIVIDNFLTKNQIIYGAYGPYYDNSNWQDNITNVGLGYRFHFKKSAIRARVSLGYDSYNYFYQENGSFENSYFNSAIAIGYEFHKDMGKAQFLYGLDLLSNTSNSESKTFNQDGEQQYLNGSKRQGFGVAPLMGIKYHFSPMISVSTELRFAIESYKQTDLSENVNTDYNNSNTISGIKTKFGPAGFLSLNVHF